MEAVTEYAENPFQALIAGLARDKSLSEIKSDVLDTATDIDVMVGSFLLGGGVHGARNRGGGKAVREAKAAQKEAKLIKEAKDRAEAQAFFDKQMEIQKLVASAETTKLLPEKVQDFLETSGFDAPVFVPATDLLTLYQNGVDLTESLGMTLPQLEDAAALLQDVGTTLAVLHTRLSTEQYAGIAPNMRASVDGLSQADIERIDEQDKADVVRMLEVFATSEAENRAQLNQKSGEQEAYNAERSRLADGFAAVINANPNLKAQVESLGGGVTSYIDDALTLVDRVAFRFAQAGKSPQEMLAKILPQTLARTMPELAKNPETRARLAEAGIVFEDTAINTQVNPAVNNPVVDVLEDNNIEGLTLEQADEFVFEASEEAKTAWQESLAGYEKNKSGRALLRAGGTSAVLQAVGAPNLPLAMQSSKMREVLESKGLAKEFMQTLPEQLANPVMIFDSATEANSLVVLSDYVHDGMPVVVAVHLNTQHDRVVINKIASVHGRKGKLGWIKEQVESGRLLYWDKSRSLAMGRELSGLQLPRVMHHARRSDGKKILTKKDIVKPREENTEKKPLESEDSTLYSKTSQKKVRGSVTVNDGKYLVNLMSKANIATLPHEFAHVFALEWQNIIQAGLADEAMTKDWAVLCKWLGADIAGNFTREQHEQFAQGFEQYLLEGKSPSRELEGVFARFKGWLTQIYKHALALGEPINDDVRGVFDRMLATQEEVAEIAAANELKSLTRKELDALGVKGADRVFAIGLMDAATKAAAIRLETARNRERGSLRKGWYAEATEKLGKEPVYIAVANIQAEGQHLDLEAVTELYGEAAVTSIRNHAGARSVAENGQNPQILAASLGFENGASMVSQIMATPKISKAAKAMVTAKEALHDAQFSPLNELVHTDEAVLQIELVGKYLAQNLRTENVNTKVFASIAREKLAEMPVNMAIGDKRFAQALRRSLREERLAIGRGDFAAALEANHKARLNLEFVRQSKDVAEHVDKTTRQIKKFVSMDKASPYARFIVMDVAMRHGLGKFNARLAEGKGITTFRDWLASATAEGYELYIDDKVLYGAGKSFKELTVNEFASLGETVTQIVTVERNIRQVSTARGKAELAEIGREISERLDKMNKKREIPIIGDQHIVLEGTDSVNYSLTKVEVLCQKLDGQDAGPLWTHVYKRIADADGKKQRRLAAESKALESLFKVYSPQEMTAIINKKVLITSMNESVTKEAMLCVAMNMGNEINHARLLESGMTEQNIAEILSHLDAKDFAFVQSIWTYFETFKEESFALDEKLKGIRPESVEARALATPFGVLAGGYFPIVYHPKKSNSARKLSEKESQADLFGSGKSGSAQTKQNHLKERAKEGLGVPLLLDFKNISSHVYNTVHDITCREAIIETNKVIRQKDVARAITDATGVKGYGIFEPWLRDFARERVDPPSWLNGVAKRLRNGTSMMAMGYKVGTALLQSSGIAVSMERLGGKYMSQGLKAVYGHTATVNPVEYIKRINLVYEQTAAKSDFMAGRMTSWNREIRDAHKFADVKSMGSNLRVVRDHAFDLIGIAQMCVDLPTWWGGYNQGLAMYEANEAKAVAHADMLVRITQGSGSVQDLAQIQRGSELQKLFTMFYSWFNTMYNVMSLTKSRIERAETTSAKVAIGARTLFYVWILSQSWEIVLDGLRDRLPDDDEEKESWGAYLFGKFGGFWTGMVPVLGSTFNSLVGGRDFHMSSVDGAIETAIRTTRRTGKVLTSGDSGKQAKALVIGGVETLGYASNMPLKPVAATIKEFWDYVDGTEPELELRKLILR